MSRDISRRHILLPITFFWVFFGLASVQPFVVPYLRDEFGMSEYRAVTVIASVYLILGVCRFFVGHVIAAIGKKATILLGVCGYVLFPVILLFWGGFAGGMVAAAALGVGGALLWTASSAQVLDVSEKEAYGRASGVLQFFTTTGVCFGTFFYHYLSRRYSVVFAVSGLLGIVALASAGLVPRVRTKVVPPSFGEMLRFITSRERLFAPVVLMIQFGTYGIMLTMTNQYIKSLPNGEAYWLKVHGCYLGAGVLVSYVAGSISDRIGRKNTLFACFALAAGGLFLFSVADSFTKFAVAAGMLGVVFGGVPTVALAYVGDISTPENRPSVHAFVYAWRDFGLVATSYIRLGLSKRVSPQTCYLVFGVLFLAVAVWMLLSARAERRRAGPTPPT